MFVRKWIRNTVFLCAFALPLNITTTAMAVPDYCTAAAIAFCRGQGDANGHPLVLGTPEFAACVAAVKPTLTECITPPTDDEDICIRNGQWVPC